MINWCKSCHGTGYRKPETFWAWLWWRTRSANFDSRDVPTAMACCACGGDGWAKPPGWPDENRMRGLRPTPPPAPPAPPVGFMGIDAMQDRVSALEIRIDEIEKRHHADDQSALEASEYNE